jgi:D-sedoheptulose 7-phosphate isomerase
MSDAERIRAGLLEAAATATRTAELADRIARAAAVMRECVVRGGTLFFAGNGGSAADAQHIVTEYVVRFHRAQHRPLRAIALTTDTSVLTAAANDLGFDRIFARQVEALGALGDVLVLHSTSGNSENLLVAARTAREQGMRTIALLGGDGGALRTEVDLAIIVPATVTARIQEMHLAIQHEICALLTEAAA